MHAQQCIAPQLGAAQVAVQQMGAAQVAVQQSGVCAVVQVPFTAVKPLPVLVAFMAGFRALSSWEVLQATFRSRAPMFLHVTSLSQSQYGYNSPPYFAYAESACRIIYKCVGS